MSDNKTYDPNTKSKGWKQHELVEICVMCTLADSMKPCLQGCICPFSIGRAVREVHNKTLSLSGDVPALERFWETLPGWLWEAYWNYAFKRFYQHGGGWYPNHLVVLEIPQKTKKTSQKVG